MISTVTLTFDLTASPPTGIVTDSTDYAALGINLATSYAKGLGVITFNGDIIVDKNTNGDPLIDLENLGSDPQVYTFPLQLDLNGNVANGVYTLEYSLRLKETSFNLTSITLPNTMLTNGYAWLANFLVADNILTLEAYTEQDVHVSSAVLDGSNVLITTSETILDDAHDTIGFDITNLQLSGVYSYSGCTQTTADVSFTYDCEVGDSGSWAVANTTALASNEVVSTLNCTINYPSWTTLSPTFPGNVVVNSLPYPSAPNTETPLATGTYTVSLTEQIQQTQTDGLILQYSTSTTQEFVVSCAGSLCGLTPCIENLRVVHANELQRNKISKYQVFVDNVLLYYAEAQNYRSCGDTANYKATINLIKSNLDASGCECACCDENTYYWVSNNSGVSVIDSLIASFQFRLNPTIPNNLDDVTKGVQVGAIWQDVSTGFLYRCTVNTEGEAEWVEYYAPGGAPTAADVPAEGGGHAILTGANVQVQLDQADLAIENIYNDAVYSASNGLTKVGNDAKLGGDLSGVTTIDVQGFTFKLNSEGDPNRFALLGGTNQVQFGQYGGGVLTGTPVYGLGVESDGKVIEVDTINTASNGLTKVNSDVQLGGDQTSDVVIDKQGHAFKINSEGDPNRFAVLGTNQIQIGNYGGNVFPGTSATYALGVDTDGKVVELPLSSGPKVYVARITQTGLSAPTATVIANTTGTTFSWSYVTSGIYRVTAASAVLTTDKTAIYTTPSGANPFIMLGNVSSTTQCIVTSSSGFSGYNDGLINGAIVKIEIYA